MIKCNMINFFTFFIILHFQNMIKKKPLLTGLPLPEIENASTVTVLGERHQISFYSTVGFVGLGLDDVRSNQV